LLQTALADSTHEDKEMAGKTKSPNAGQEVFCETSSWLAAMSFFMFI